MEKRRHPAVKGGVKKPRPLWKGVRRAWPINPKTKVVPSAGLYRRGQMKRRSRQMFEEELNDQSE